MSRNRYANYSCGSYVPGAFDPTCTNISHGGGVFDTYMAGVARHNANFYSQSRFYAQAANGTLPAFSYFYPTWQACDHPCQDLAKGERVLKDVCRLQNTSRSCRNPGSTEGYVSEFIESTCSRRCTGTRRCGLGPSGTRHCFSWRTTTSAGTSITSYPPQRGCLRPMPRATLSTTASRASLTFDGWGGGRRRCSWAGGCPAR
jgi:hypothetical protein